MTIQNDTIQNDTIDYPNNSNISSRFKRILNIIMITIIIMLIICYTTMVVLLLSSAKETLKDDIDYDDGYIREDEYSAWEIIMLTTFSSLLFGGILALSCTMIKICILSVVNRCY
jgi:magnesium-transporting ATPase (P-type)